MMTITAILLQAVAAPLAPVPAIAALPGEVKRFVARYDDCKHWMGEDGYDAARTKQIARGVARSCKGIDTAGDRLKRRYASNASVTAALVAYPPLTR